MLVAAMNPCPCGYYNDPTHACHCSPAQVQRYKGKVSGPLLDRIDLQIEVSPVPVTELAKAPKGMSSAEMREQVVAARTIQTERFKNDKGVHCNAQMSSKQLETYAQLNAEAASTLNRTMERLQLSGRAYTRILKVARTIADLDGSANIEVQHIKEAVGYRSLDRADWGE